MEDIEKFANFYHRQTVAILIATFWLIFWPATFFIYIEETES